MNDITAVAGQLARLRESLQHKQFELDETVLCSQAERSRSIQFIAKLMQACRGHDRELDSKLAKLKQKLDGQPALTALDQDLAAIEKLLQQHSTALEESISLTAGAIELGSRQLKSLKGFPEETRKSLKAFLAAPNGYGLSDHQRRITQLLEFYQQAIKIQLLPANLPPSTVLAIARHPRARRRPGLRRHLPVWMARSIAVSPMNCSASLPSSILPVL